MDHKIHKIRTTPDRPAYHVLMQSPSLAATQIDFDALAEALPTLVLTGAGISAGAGIPTYRDEKGIWLRSEPIKHQEFMTDPRARRRYWGRSLLGWPAIRDARPSQAHRLLAQLEQTGAIKAIVTQNVDRLHQRAGSVRVTDLHGRLDRVLCLGCGAYSDRETLQNRLERSNPRLHSAVIDSQVLRPDGDADLSDDLVSRVTVPACTLCNGVLMPDVVFFGGSIPQERVLACESALNNAKSLLVIGSSLQVYSGYRFCRWAQRMGKPIFIINPGLTRADNMATRYTATADSALATLIDRLGADYSTRRKNA